MKQSRSTFIHLWPKKAPYAQGNAAEDIPAIRVFLPPPEKATGAAMLVYPGGGYVIHAEHEGVPVAQWLAANGIVAFVVRYRLGWKYHHPVQLLDGQRAIRYVRAHAAHWNIDPERIGILGFSAGGHLVSMLSTNFDDGNADDPDLIERFSSRPDIQVLIYPVITLGPNYGVWWNILDQNPPVELIDLFCTERHIKPQTPPAFLAHSINDVGVPVMNSDVYAASLAAAGIPYEYVREDLGDHGFGMIDQWTLRCLDWLRRLGYAAPAEEAIHEETAPAEILEIKQ